MNTYASSLPSVSLLVPDCRLTIGHVVMSLRWGGRNSCYCHMAFCFRLHFSAFSLMLPICGLKHYIAKSNKENENSGKIQIFFTIKISKLDVKCNTSSYLIQTRDCFYLQQTCYEIWGRPIPTKKYYCTSRYQPYKHKPGSFARTKGHP